MSEPKRGTVVPWSYSSLSAFEECPRRFYLTKISKQVSEPPYDHRQHGNIVHKAMELAVAGTKPLTPDLTKFQPLVDKLRAAPGVKHLEGKFALDSSLKPVEYWAPTVWVRGVIDYATVKKSTATILDYKSGKRRVDLDQLRLFALAGFSLWSNVERVDTGYVWLQSKQLDREQFTREDVVTIHRDFASRVHRMEVSQQKDDWPARPSGLCREWCPVGKSLCVHCGK